MPRLPHLRRLDQAQREEVLQRLERLTELPLLVLAFVMIPLLVGPFVWDLSAREEAAFAAVDIFIWAVFAVDLGLKVAIAPHSKEYLRRHWLEVLIVVVPFFRPLRLLRLLLFGSRFFVGFRQAVRVDFLVVYAVGMVMISSTVVLTIEQDQPGATITTFPNALWWAVVTVTTVGYGDIVPVSAAGRGIAFLLMLGGIAFFSGITANLASVLVGAGQSQNSALNQLSQEIQSLRQEIAGLRGDHPDNAHEDTT
ncbi:MAG: ion transporter [SAR202 cluster bacterium]|nr:ion transporter [SAR202 cluster bacterium]